MEFKVVDGPISFDIIKQYWNLLKVASPSGVSLEEGLAPAQDGVLGQDEIQLRLVRTSEAVVHLILFQFDQVDHFKLELDPDCAQEDRKFFLKQIKTLHRNLFNC